MSTAFSQSAPRSGANHIGVPMALGLTLALALPLSAQNRPAMVTMPPSAYTAARGSSPAVLTITARDFRFDAPDTIAACVTTIRLVNRGPDLHHMWIVRLEDGKTEADFVRALKAGGPPPKWAVDVGGPNAPVPGAESNATVTFTPGNYAILCLIPGKDHVPHMMKGMVRSLTVTPPSNGAVLPKEDVVMTLDDYEFRLSRPLTAGKRTILVRNAAAQSHEVELVRIPPGKSMADLHAWLEKEDGPPPAIPLGGVSGMAPGAVATFTADLEPGTYALVCFAPDAKDGKPHFAHGMTKEFKVN